MPGQHSGDQVHKIKKTAAPSLLYFAAAGKSLPRTIAPRGHNCANNSTSSEGVASQALAALLSMASVAPEASKQVQQQLPVQHDVAHFT